MLNKRIKALLKYFGVEFLFQSFQAIESQKVMSQTFLLVGASSRIAKETANQLNAKGHKVIAISTKPNEAGYTDFHSIEKYDFGSFPIRNDAIDGLVYFPGTINLKPFNRLGATEFNMDMSINAIGAAACAQAYLDNLKKSSGASVVFVSTVAVSIGMPFHASIAMAKGAIEGLTKSLAAELAPGIRVNAVAPSLTDTPMGEKFINSPEKLVRVQKGNPMRKVGSAVEIANAISFLLSDESAWITGQVLAVDGGMNTLKNG